MDDWDRRMTPRPKSVPRLDLIEMCWRVVGPSQHVIECGIYHTDIGFDVRVSYRESIEDLIQSQFAVDIGKAREIADRWKRAAIEKGFEEWRATSDDR